jgi:rod shape-determining protein MreD
VAAEAAAAGAMIRRIRLGFVILGAVVLQTTLFTHLRIFGVAPDVGLVAVLAVAYEEGADTGAVFGFLTGLAIDMFLTTPAGLSALSYAVTGYIVGIIQSGMLRETQRIAPILGGIGGFFGGLVFVTVGGVVGQSGFLSFHSLRTIAIAALYDVLIAPIVFPVARRAAREHGAAEGWRTMRSSRVGRR